MMGPPESDPWANSEQDTSSDAEDQPANREAALREKREAALENHLRTLQIFSHCEFVKHGKEGGGKQPQLQFGQSQVPSSIACGEKTLQQNPGSPQLPQSDAGDLEGSLNNLDVYEVYITIPNENGVKGLYNVHVLVQRKDLSDCSEGDDQCLDVKEIRIYRADEDPAEAEEAFEIQLPSGNDPTNLSAFIRHIKPPRPKQRMQKYRSARFYRKRKQNVEGVPQPPKRMCAPEFDSDHGSRTKPGQNAKQAI